MKKLTIFSFIVLSQLLWSNQDLPFVFTLTEQHRFLRNFEGKWRILYTSSLQTGEQYHGKGTSENSIIMGWKYLQIREEIAIEGIPAMSLAIIGYNPVEEMFNLTGFDNFAFKPIVAKGNLDKDNNQLIFQYEYYDPINKKALNQKTVIKLLEPEKYSYSIFIIDEGKEKLMVEKLAIKLE